MNVQKFCLKLFKFYFNIISIEVEEKVHIPDDWRVLFVNFHSYNLEFDFEIYMAKIHEHKKRQMLDLLFKLCHYLAS